MMIRMNPTMTISVARMPAPIRVPMNGDADEKRLPTE
jgi:hypothetical protein